MTQPTTFEAASEQLWVFCGGMVRSASTLQYQITTAIVSELGVGRGLGIHKAESFTDLFRQHMHERRILVVKTHDCFDEAAALLAAGRARALYSYRDLREVVASWMRMQGWTFEQVIERRFIEETCLERDAEWMSVDHLLVTRYEDLDDDTLEHQVNRIADHLGLTLLPEVAARIALEHTRPRQIERIRNFNFDADGVQSDTTRYDPSTLLHDRHITAPEVGAGLDGLNHQQIEVIERIAGDWLVDHGYTCTREPRSFRTDSPTADASNYRQWVKAMSERIIEIPWAIAQLPQNGIILDVGSCEATYLQIILSESRTLHCMDARDCFGEMPPSVIFHHEDLLGNGLPRGYFDAVLLISTLEHIGMPHYDQRGFDHGDALALAEISELLKPGCPLILTLPAGRSKVASWYRQYSPTDLARLFAGWEHSIVYWGYDQTQYVPIKEPEVELFDYNYSVGAGAIAGIVAYSLTTLT